MVWYLHEVSELVVQIVVHGVLLIVNTRSSKANSFWKGGCRDVGAMESLGSRLGRFAGFSSLSFCKADVNQ